LLSAVGVPANRTHPVIAAQAIYFAQAVHCLPFADCWPLSAIGHIHRPHNTLPVIG